jgi:hypothetical protein
MKIKTHIAVSLDGYISTPDGWPAILTSPDFEVARTATPSSSPTAARW